MTPDAHGRWAVPQPYDFSGTTRLIALGAWDPTMRRDGAGWWRTAHTVDGAATVRLVPAGMELQADAWGPGAAAVLVDVPHWVGLHEAPWELPPHPVTDRLLHTHRGLRSTDLRDVFEALLIVVLQQLVTWQEAAAMWRRLCVSIGEAAPGPVDMRLSPTPRAVLGAGTLGLQAAGIGMGQVRTIIDIARVAPAVRRAAALPTLQAAGLLQKVRGVGPWTAHMALGMRLGRADAIPVGDFHLPHTVAWALAGEPRGTDARMLELLAPLAGHECRVLRLLSAAHIEAPRRGPRYPSRRRPTSA